jgi:NAD(P)-dependent dehydrogenase (short-subunit alcohol dehydrogenase family)
MANGKAKKDLDMPDLSRRLAIVTGANSGIGLGITRRLAASGADVILAVRNLDKGNEAIKDIIKEKADAQLTTELVDLADLQSVKDFAERLIRSGRPVNYLFNNAGLMTSAERFTTYEGFELHFAANYLGHFALTARLMPLLCASDYSRVVMISSSTAHSGSINFDDLQSEKEYSSANAYAQSKLAMLMFAMQLNSQSRKYGWGIVSNAAHPGATITNIQSLRSVTVEGKAEQSFFTRLGMKMPGIWQNIERGCLPALFAATHPDAFGGAYYGPGGIFELSGFPKAARVPSKAKNKADLKRLWDVSEQLVKVQFPLV